MDKGSRVKVVKGRKSVGVTGTIFWIGDNKWGDGKRAGIEGDDGETHWINVANLEETDEVPPEVEPPEKGTKVRFEGEDGPVLGEVFWIGESKSGNGIRLGVRDGDGEAHWMDSRKVEIIDGFPAEEGAAETWNDEEPPF